MGTQELDPMRKLIVARYINQTFPNCPPKKIYEKKIIIEILGDVPLSKLKQLEYSLRTTNIRVFSQLKNFEGWYEALSMIEIKNWSVI